MGREKHDQPGYRNGSSEERCMTGELALFCYFLEDVLDFFLGGNIGKRESNREAESGRKEGVNLMATMGTNIQTCLFLISVQPLDYCSP